MDNLTIVTVTYSFDSEVLALLFTDYKSACKYIKEDFEREKNIDVEENGWEIDKTLTKCEENYAVLATIYPSDSEVQTVTWTIARVIDER